MIKIITDTTCDMPSEWVERYNITTIPINIHFGQEAFLEEKTITADTFYARIDQDQMLPTTSQPSIGQFTQLYNQLGQDGSDILSIHITSKLSGTWQSAYLTAQQMADQVPITVIDSLIGSTGLGFMVREAATLVEAGWPISNIVPHLEARRPHIMAFFMLHNLRHARMSGRVGRIQEALAALLNVKPIICVDGGALVPLDRTRSKRTAIERMVDLAAKALGDKPVHIGVVHALAPDAAYDLLQKLQGRLNYHDAIICDMALSLAVHFGPGTIGFTVYPAE